MSVYGKLTYIFVTNPEGKRPRGRPRCKRDNDVQIVSISWLAGRLSVSQQWLLSHVIGEVPYVIFPLHDSQQAIQTCKKHTTLYLRHVNCYTGCKYRLLYTQGEVLESENYETQKMAASHLPTTIKHVINSLQVLKLQAVKITSIMWNGLFSAWLSLHTIYNCAIISLFLLLFKFSSTPSIITSLLTTD
jgi:hypothetical protein